VLAEVVGLAADETVGPGVAIAEVGVVVGLFPAVVLAEVVGLADDETVGTGVGIAEVGVVVGAFVGESVR